MKFKSTFLYTLMLGVFFSTFGQTLPTFVETGGVVNDTPATAQSLVTLPSKVKGTIFPIADVDYYSFSAQAGDKIFATCMTSFSSGSSTDAVLTLYASDGTTIIETDNDDGTLSGTSPSIAGATIPAAGIYYIKVNCFSATATIRPYFLYLNVVTGVSSAEVEPNDTTPTATPLAGNLFANGSLSSLTDIDYYSITLTAGETVYVSLDFDPERDTTTWNGQLTIGTFGATNTALLVNDTNAVSPNSEAFPLTVLNSGTYYIGVSVPTGGTTFGTYQLAISRHAATTGYTNYAGATGLGAAIPNGAALPNITSTINIPTTGRIKDIAVNLDLVSSAMLDLDVILTAPDGSSMALFTDIGNATFTTMKARFSDNAAIPPAFAVVDGIVYQPELSSWLDSFKNTNMQGNWTLTIYDDTNNASTGTLNNWSIDILTEPDTLTGGTQIYGNDFETTDGGLTHSGTADSWAWGTPTATPINTAFSGSKCWKTNLTGTYAISSVNTLVTPTIDLSAVSSGITYVKWAMKSQFESATFDNLKITAEEVGGLNRIVELYNWYGATQNQNIGIPATATNFANAWSVNYANLSLFNGSSFILKFNLTTDTSVNYAGLAIDDIFVFSDALLSTSEVGNKIGFNVYPNPTNSKVTLLVNNDNFSTNMNYKLYDLKGRELQSNKIESLETTISLDKLSSGIYLLEVSSLEGKTVKRIIKE